jgi:hypothetical protein
MSDADVHGPVDFVVVEFPTGAAGASTASALVDLVDGGTVRLWDMLLVRKGADGSCVELDLGATDGSLDGLTPLAGARSGLLGVDDLQDVAGALEPDKVAAVIVYENAWAVPFVAAARQEGGQLVASSRLTAQEILDALDAVESE